MGFRKAVDLRLPIKLHKSAIVFTSTIAKFWRKTVG